MILENFAKIRCLVNEIHKGVCHNGGSKKGVGPNAVKYDAFVYSRCEQVLRALYVRNDIGNISAIAEFTSMKITHNQLKRFTFC